jgi:hypothetical protein
MNTAELELNNDGGLARIGGRTFWLVLGITLLGAAFRLYNIYSASPFVYEYAWSVDIVPGHYEALRASHALYGPLHPPVSDLVLYLTGSFIGMDYGSLRIPGALMNILGIPLLYLLVRGISGQVAGLTAALLFALSPTQIWWSQVLTTYPFTIPLAMVSLLLVRRAVQRSSGVALAGCVAVNSLLLMTHIFYVFLLAAEGFYLLLAFWGRLRYLAWWSAGNLLGVLATLAYLYPNLPYYFSAGSGPMPPGLFWIGKFFGDDVFPYTLEFAFEQWSLLPRLPLALLGPIPVALSLVTLVGTIGAVAYLFVMKAGLVRSWFMRPAAAAQENESGGLLLLTALKVVPIAGVLLATFIGLPVYPYRLVSYIAVALYGWLGAAFAVMAPAYRRVLLTLFVAVYAIQAGMIHAYEMRTDWRTPVRVVEAAASPEDLILVNLLDAPAGRWLWNRESGGSQAAVRDAYTATDVIWQVNEHLAVNEATVWVVVEDGWRGSNHAQLVLDELGLPRTEYPAYGVSRVIVYEVNRPFGEHVLAKAVEAQLSGSFCEAMIAPLAGVVEDTLDRDDCVQLLRLFRSSWLDWYYFGAGGLAGASLELLDRGEISLSKGLSELAVQANPGHPYGYFARALVTARLEGLDAARADFEAMRARDTRVFMIFNELIDALYDARRPEEIDEALHPLLDLYALPEVLRELAMERREALRRQGPA